MNRQKLLFVQGIFWICFGLASHSFGADFFGDVVVFPQSLVSGPTYHGYREFRIVLENKSVKTPHRVTLVFPEQSYANYGNAISRLSRTVNLAPLSRVVVPLWQPPLPQNGNGSLRVQIDGEESGTANLPGGTEHVNRGGPHSGGAQLPSVILVSRSLNYDDLSRAINGKRTAQTADTATGPPDSTGAYGAVSTAWMPDSTMRSAHWLELDYDKPIQANQIQIYTTITLPAGGEVILTGVSGTNVGHVSISGPSYSGSSRGMMQRFSFPPTSEPVKTVRLNFGPAYGGSISIDAVGLEGAGGSGMVWASSARASSEASLTSSGTIRGVSTYELLRAESPVTEWSEYWLSYTPFDGIALSAADLRSMPPAATDVLWRYVESGGNLFVFGGGEIPGTWRPTPKISLEGGKGFEAGFGQCYLLESEKTSDLGFAAAKVLADAANASARSWQSLPDENGANGLLPVIENLQVPVRGIVLIMLVFVIVIGPVNLIVLSRLNRRTWLLWTVPAISIFTSLMVFLYSMFHEGVTPNARIDSFTFLDQVNRRAASQGITGFYCPLTPSQGLFFGSETEATPLIQMWENRSGSPREVDWSEGQHLQRGWVTARVPAHFQLRKSESHRERLQLEGSGDQLSVVNGLGAPVRSLWLADHTGRIFTASNIAVGQKAKLAPATESPKATEKLGARALLTQNGCVLSGKISGLNVSSYLLPDSYIVELEANPFIENGLGPKAKSDRLKSSAVVFGLLEPTP